MKTALVTGAGSGIGAALSRALHAKGWRVMLTDIRADGIEALAATLGSHAHAHVLDVTDRDAWQALAQQLRDASLAVDLLVNNAGAGQAGAVELLADSQWDRILRINLEGTLHGIRTFYPAMQRRGSGHIVNIASGAGLMPRPMMVPYATAKHAVVGLTTSLAAEAHRHGVRVQAICPGYVGTDILRSTEYVGLDSAKLQASIPLPPLSAERCAARIVRGLDSRKTVLTVSLDTRVEWCLYRLAPNLWTRITALRSRAFARAAVESPDIQDPARVDTNRGSDSGRPAPGSDGRLPATPLRSGSSLGTDGR